MSSEADMEKEFSKNIDHLLSGEEMESTHMSDDYLSALDFAQKLVTLRDNPSPLYTAQLKEKLLLELREKETPISREPRGNWFINIINGLSSNRRVWQMAAATVLIAVIFGGVWSAISLLTPGTPSEPSPAKQHDTASPAPSAPSAPSEQSTAPSHPSQPESAPAPSDAYLIKVSAESLKESYFPNEEITFMVSVENKSTESIQLEQFPPDIQIEHSPSNKVVHVIHSNGTEQTVPPEQTVSITISWDQTDDQGNPVEYGYYRIKPEDIRYNAEQEAGVFPTVVIQIIPGNEQKGE
jgi:hypothetical protein